MTKEKAINLIWESPKFKAIVERNNNDVPFVNFIEDEEGMWINFYYLKQILESIDND